MPFSSLITYNGVDITTNPVLHCRLLFSLPILELLLVLTLILALDNLE